LLAKSPHWTIPPPPLPKCRVFYELQFAFFGGPLSSSQSEQLKIFSKAMIGRIKAGPPKKSLLF